MRRPDILSGAFACCLLVLALPAAAFAVAGPFPPPPDPETWSAGPQASRAEPRLALDAATPAPSGAASLRLEFRAPAEAAQANGQDQGKTDGKSRGDAAGDAALACIVRRGWGDLSGASGLEFSVRADAPALCRITVETSNAETHANFDRFFGTFVAGEKWRSLRIPFRSLAPDPAWTSAAPGDRVLRPDSVEEIRICVEAGRLAPGAGALRLGDVRFFKFKTSAQ